MADNTTIAILEALADAEGVDIDQLDCVLYDYIDPDALDRLAKHEGTSWTVSFRVPDHNVTVTSDGRILVDGDREKVLA